jgi:quinoprotein relay system zinc metallohydrolase 2
MKPILFSLALLFSPLALAIQPLTMQQVAPGIYAHLGPSQWPDTVNHGEIANIGFIVGERCVAVIDTGGSPEQGIALRHAIEKITQTPICYVINTHVHPDHVYGNKAFKTKGVQFIGHHKLPRAMATRGQYYLDKAHEQLDIQLNADNLIAPDTLVKETLTLDLGGRELLLTAHPTAHTDNDLSVYDKKTDTMWLADLLFLEHLPVIDGSLKGWLAELDKLEKRHFQHVIPGHGPVVSD